MKRISALLSFVLILFALLKTPVFADTPTPEPQPTDTSPTSISYKINDLAIGDDPSLLADLYTLPDKRIDGNTRIAWVQFTNLDTSKQYTVCGGFESGTCQNHFKPVSDGTITIAICGDGEETSKGVQVQGYKDKVQLGSGGKLHEKCNESRDFFHEGHTYKVSLYNDYDDKSDRPNPNDETTSIVAAKFFVAHSYPLVKINSKDSATSPVEITLWGRRPGNDNSNNYQVVVEGTDNAYKKEHCYNSIPDKNWWTDNLTVGVNTQFDAVKNISVPEFILNGTGFNTPARPATLGQTNTFGRGKDESSGNLGRGTYIVKINERVSDNRPLGVGNSCEGGFTYMHVFFQITKNGIQILKVVYDPNNSDRNDIESIPPVPPIPCAAGEIDEDTGTCKAFNVALLGKIPLDPYSFIKSVYNIVLSVAGISAMAIIIRSGYKFLYSRGDKEAIADARARLTSAIIGLAFIIFAYVILSIIGVDILKLPGFG